MRERRARPPASCLDVREEDSAALAGSDSMTETELLAHYVERGGEPWNVSLEAAWLDYELRAWMKPRLPARWPVAVCNVGIGVGLWLG